MNDTDTTDLNGTEQEETPSLEAELARAKSLSVESLADAIESIGFECTRCGACCTAHHEGDDEQKSEYNDEPDSVNAAGSDTSRDDNLKTDNSVSTVDSGHVDHSSQIADQTQTVDNEGQKEHHDMTTQSASTEPHTATVFPDEIRELQTATDDIGDDPVATGDGDGQASTEWRDVARPMPYGLDDENETGTTFEWALQTNACGDCVFYDETDGIGSCQAHDDRPLICATYPFSVALGGTSQPMGEAVDKAGMVRAHECEGLGRDISREAAEELAATLRTRAIRELNEAISLRDAYEPTGNTDGIVVHDSEGAKRPDGTVIDN